MSIPPQDAGDRRPFQLYPFAGSSFYAGLERLIEDGHYHRNIPFKLAAIGIDEVDPETKSRLTWHIVNDLIKNADTPEKMRSDTQAILAAEMPDAIIDWQYSDVNADAYATFEHMFYRVRDLSTTIYENDPTMIQEEEARRVHANAAARGLWKVLVTRYHPEWLNGPSPYYASRISFETAYDANEKTMRRRIVGHAVLSDPLIFDTYSEAVAVGVKGIGPKGKESLRMLLSEEHPELQ